MKNNQLQLVTFEQAKKLANLGFDWPCRLGYLIDKEYSNDAGTLLHDVRPFAWNDWERGNVVSAPTVALALKWFREEKKLISTVDIMGNRKFKFFVCDDNAFDVVTDNETEFDIYEEAENSVLDELLNIIEL